jgi:hypothetical protein
MARLIMDPKGVTLHQRPPAPTSDAVVMTWVALAKGHFAYEQQGLEAWITTWTQDPDVVAWAQPQIVAGSFLKGFNEAEAGWCFTCARVLAYFVDD